MSDNYQKVKSSRPKKGFSKRQDDYIRFEPNRSENVFDEEIGTPRRKSKKDQGFQFIPQEMKKFRGREAEKIREHLSFMVFAHGCFLFLEIFCYNMLVTMVISEIFYLWLVYYCFMTLNECATYSYVALMFMAPVTGVFRVLDVGLGLSTLLYIA